MNSKAKESAQIRKYRRKLKKQMESETALMNETALKKVKESIQLWISRHSGDRINLQDKSISLFDENRHPARTESAYVQNLFAQLRKEAERKESKEK